MRTIYFIAFSFLFFGCEQSGLTDSETRGIQEIFDFYGGDLNVAKGITNRTGEKIEYCEIKMNNSNLIGYPEDKIEFVASNIAYIFDDNLNDSDSDYDEIRIIISHSEGLKYKRTYIPKLLSEVKEYHNVYLSMSSDISKSDYHNIGQYFEEKYRDSLDYNSFEVFFDSLYVESGGINEVVFQGFKAHSQNEEPFRYMELMGYHQRDLEKSYFGLYIDRDSGNVLELEM